MIGFRNFTKLSAIAMLAIVFSPFVNQAAAAEESTMDANSTEKQLHLPERPSRGQGANDYNDPNSEYCFQRSVQGDNIAIFWSKEYGDDPLNHSEPNKTFDVNYMLSECERYYKTYVEVMKLVVKGKSVSDKYKLIVFVIGGPGGTAFGGGDEDIATLSAPATRVNKPPYGVLAHEMVHCFQHMSRRDGAHGGGVNPEMGAQHGLWQNLPEWMTFENYHLVALMDQTHLAFDHPSNMYHTAHVMEYFLASLKDGKRVYGNVGTNPQDALAFQVPENTEYLWLVVMGAPKEHSAVRMGRGMRRRRGQPRVRGGGTEERPYQIKLTGTTLDDSFIE